jgi:hypothetical protein
MPNNAQVLYNWSLINVVKNGSIDVDANCNSLSFRNDSGVGGSPVTVNGVLLNPSLVAGASGESFSIPGNLGEIFKGRIDVAFTLGGVAQHLTIIQKFYLP